MEQQAPVSLIQAVGDSFRMHYRQKCRGVNWMHKLHTLQLIAVCLGELCTVPYSTVLYDMYQHYLIDFMIILQDCSIDEQD